MEQNRVGQLDRPAQGTAPTAPLGMGRVEAKPMILSRTTWGLALMLIPMIGRWFGFDFNSDDMTQAQTIANSAMALIDEILLMGGAVLAFYGRWRARQVAKLI